jgi:hypothetical protein
MTRRTLVLTEAVYWRVGSRGSGRIPGTGGGGAKADDSQAYYFLDSYGDVVPVDPEVIALGVYPPPIPGGGNGPDSRHPERPEPVRNRKFVPATSEGGGDSCMGTTTHSSNATAPIVRKFVCSSVDIMPFIYSLALGNESWRMYSCDLINYLGENIVDSSGRSC